MKALFINTRPKNHTICLDDMGIQTVALPLLQIIPFLGIDHEVYLDEFLAGKFSVVVAVSVQAVQCAIALLQQKNIHHARDLDNPPTFVAVGSATAQALRAFGFVVLTPDEMSNEGMLAMPIIQALTCDDEVLIWRGVGGRRLLSDELVARGVGVHSAIFYERCVPMELPKEFDDILPIIHDYAKRELPVFVLISSEMSLGAWRGVQDDGVDYQYVVLGERLERLTAQTFMGHRIHRVGDLDIETLKHTLNQAMGA